MKIKNKKVVRVNEFEFELEDGTIQEHFEKLEEVPTLEEFQKIYDKWTEIFNKEIFIDNE